MGEGIFIKDNPVTGACPYLDGGCTIYDKRPQVCRDYSCSVDGKIKGMVSRVKTQDLKLRRRVIDDLMEISELINFNVEIEINNQIELGDAILNVLVNAEYTDTYGDDYLYRIILSEE